MGDCQNVNQEPILMENEDRYVVYPIDSKNLDAFMLYKKHVACFWTPEEVDLEEDIRHWEKLTTDERFFLSHILAFFAASDGIVNENLAKRFYNEIQVAELKLFYGFQIAMEGIHNEVYSIFIDSLIKDNQEKDKLFHAIQDIESVKKKAKWAEKWIENEDASFAERLVAFAAVEGILFSGSFCAIFWLKKRGVMPGLCLANEWISRDEGLHTLYAVCIYKKLHYPLSRSRVLEIIKDAVLHEKQFISQALPVSLIGLNCQLMQDYIEFVADILLDMLGYQIYYGKKNPFDWMELISMEGKTNFFERRVSEYQRSNVMHVARKRVGLPIHNSEKRRLLSQSCPSDIVSSPKEDFNFDEDF